MSTTTGRAMPSLRRASAVEDSRRKQGGSGASVSLEARDAERIAGRSSSSPVHRDAQEAPKALNKPACTIVVSKAESELSSS